MEAFKTLLTRWTDNPPVNYGLMLRRTVVRSIGVVSLNKRWFETPQCKPKPKLPRHVSFGCLMSGVCSASAILPPHTITCYTAPYHNGRFFYQIEYSITFNCNCPCHDFIITCDKIRYPIVAIADIGYTRHTCEQRNCVSFNYTYSLQNQTNLEYIRIDISCVH